MRLGGGTTASSSSPRRRPSLPNIEEDDTRTVMPGDASSALSAPWEHLLSSTISPAAAVAVKMAISEEEPEEQQPTSSRRSAATENGGLLGTIHRHLPSLSKLSLGAATATKGDQGALLSRYRQARFSSRRVRKRVVFKNGDCNVVQGNVAKRRRRYLQDIFTTLVDAQWRWTLLVFALNFLLSWLGFAIIWWLIVYSHDDLNPENNPKVAAALGTGSSVFAVNNSKTKPTDAPVSTTKEWTPCIREVSGFASCFLFSVETQHTIGYGSRHTTEECPEAIFVMCLQSIVGVMIQAFMVGIVFAKLSRPKKRTQTLLFSRNAVICQRDGHLCLMFRVGDMRKSHIVEAHVRAQLIRRKVTQEGEVLPYYQHELTVGGDGEEDKIFFIWPTTIVHKIDLSSPLYFMSAAEMIRERFEIVVILEGVIESTGMTTQARSSYLPSEVLWGHRFEPLVAFKKETGEYEVDYSLFNNTYEVDTPLCNAKALDELRNMQQQQQRGIHQNEHQQRLERLMSPTKFPALRAPPDTLDLGSVDSNSVSIEEQPSVVTVTSPIDLPGPESSI